MIQSHSTASTEYGNSDGGPNASALGLFLFVFWMVFLQSRWYHALMEVVAMMNQWMPQMAPQMMTQMPQTISYQQRQEVLRVNGENGARMISIAPNSSVLALDENNPIVWFCQSDGAGYKTVTPYKIVPVVQEQQANISDLVARVDKLEERLNGKSDTRVSVAEPAEQHRCHDEPVPREKPTGSSQRDVFY